MAVNISLSITQNSQDVTHNTSKVTVNVTASWTYGSYNAVVDANGTPQANGWVKIDGTSYNFASTFNTGRTTTGSEVICTKTVNVSHNTNGTKTLQCSASFSTGVSSGTVTTSASKTLTTIPRKSTLSASNGTLGTEQTITVTRQSSSFTHTITYKCGSASGYVGDQKTSKTSISWTPPLSLASQNTTGSSVSITLTITTYSGSTSIGSNTKTIGCSIPSSVKPTVSISVSDSTANLTKYGRYVQKQSKPKIVLSASGNRGSTIKSYRTTFDGKSYTASSFTTSVISGTGTLTISASVTDSRGRTGTATKTIQVLPYSYPTISSISVKRTNSNGASNSSGEYLTVFFKSSITALNNKNRATYTVKYKKESSSSYTTATLSSLSGTYTVSNGTYTFAADGSSGYNIVLTVSDNFSSATRTIYGSSISKLFSILRGGLGFAFGKIATLSGYLDIGFNTMFRKPVSYAHNVSEYGTDSDGTSVQALCPINSSGNTVLGYGNYSRKKGIAAVYGYDVYIGVSNQATPGSYKPYYSRGDSFTITLRTAGYIANSAKDLSFWLPLANPVIGSPTISVSSVDGFILRQGNAYTHGSAGSTFVKPSSYEATATYANGIYIKATFSNVTNATNNDTIGIYWSGKVTFS